MRLSLQRRRRNDCGNLFQMLKSLQLWFCAVWVSYFCKLSNFDRKRALRGLIEELSYQLSQMSADQKTRYLDLDQWLGELVRIQKDAVAVKPTQPSASAVLGGFEPSPATQVAVPEISDQDAYNAAFEMIRERKFDEALVALDSFVQVYPESELVLDARFWRGQVFDVLGRDQEAIETFKGLTLAAPDYRRILQVKVKLEGC